VKNLGQIVSRLIDVLTSFGAWVAVICILVMVIYTGVDVVGRYLVGWTTGVCEEMSAYMLVAITFMAGAYTFVQKGHITVNVVLNKLTPRGQKAMNIINGILGFGTCVAVTWYSSKLVMTSLTSHAGSEFASMTPLWMPQLLVPVGMGILSLVTLRYTIRLFCEEV